jgi:hypothetical protein
VPGEGSWREVLLIDGNVGIGGSPVRLLLRAAQLLLPDGAIHVEVEPPGGRSGSSRIRLEGIDGPVGAWFPWSWLCADSVDAVAAQAGLSVRESWNTGNRWFAELRR